MKNETFLYLFFSYHPYKKLKNVVLEIQGEILKRLPLIPLIQFRSVSKSYKRLIDSPDFIVSYIVRQPQPEGRFILRYVYSDDGFKDRYLSLVDNEDDGFVQQEFIPTIPNLIKEFKYHFDDFIICEPSVVGSSHGLLCFYLFGKKMVVLWNPSIRKSIGFGVSPVTFDPTILMIQCIDDNKRKKKDMPILSVPGRVRVFTLSTGTWSVLSTNLTRESISLSGSQVLIDGIIYWLAFDMIDAEDGLSQSHSLLMSFDLTTKEFKEINFPDSLTNSLCTIETIGKLHESLLVLESHIEADEGVHYYCLWMMKEQGVNRSFSKLYKISVPQGIVKTLIGFRKTGELILETQTYLFNTELEIYDPNSEAIDNLGIDGNEDSFFMCPYMESLLLLDHLDGFIYLINN